ncbi:GNAT family N-acetyltransferase [Paenibacillus sp. PK4536]|jgi:ribosomal protein S18 acetylase RimI-like enzyme|uniref:GNAT family N-acetyltransferase n=1 Tax=Paenibacillus sp. PK4536 TaxID=3024576 RepID=UPI0023592BE2|nr:GNAT family N-acetyltransferase [Paenibacillus sp. PK4536]WIM37650.1 GNAT family N-acetyltransferase [Paenibacillus sp. PK4536]
MHTWSIRAVTADDQNFLWETLYLSLYVREGEAPFDREVIYEPHLAKYVEDWGQAGDVGYIAINDQQQPIGAVTARVLPADNQGYGYIDEVTPELGLAVLDEYRGQGVGTALMQALLTELRQQQIAQVSLSVDPSNPVVRLYERLGFEKVAVVGTSITMLLVL